MKYENKCRGFMVELWPKLDVVTQVKLIIFLPRFSIFILKSANHCSNFIFVNISVGIHFSKLMIINTVSLMTVNLKYLNYNV